MVATAKRPGQGGPLMTAFIVAVFIILQLLGLWSVYRVGFATGFQAGQIIALNWAERKVATIRLRKEHAVKGYGLGTLDEGGGA